MDTQQQNFVVNLINYAQILIELSDDLGTLNAQWTQNGFDDNITNAVLQQVPSLAYLTQAELTAAMSSIQAFLTTMGDKTSGNLVNLIKVQE